MSIVQLMLLILNISYAVFAPVTEFFSNSEWRDSGLDRLAKSGLPTSVFTEIKEAQTGEKRHLIERQKDREQREVLEHSEVEVAAEGGLGVAPI